MYKRGEISIRTECDIFFLNNMAFEARAYLKVCTKKAILPVIIHSMWCWNVQHCKLFHTKYPIRNTILRGSVEKSTFLHVIEKYHNTMKVDSDTSDRKVYRR